MPRRRSVSGRASASRASSGVRACSLNVPDRRAAQALSREGSPLGDRGDLRQAGDRRAEARSPPALTTSPCITSASIRAPCASTGKRRPEAAGSAPPCPRLRLRAAPGVSARSDPRSPGRGSGGRLPCSAHPGNAGCISGRQTGTAPPKADRGGKRPAAPPRRRPADGHRRR